MKTLRLGVAMICLAIGTIGFILPGSILFLLVGLMLLAIDYPAARQWLRTVQRSASRGAQRLDRFLLSRKTR